VKIVLALLACGLALQAQPWEVLKGLNPGEKIKVRAAGGEEYHGVFRAVSDRGISLDTHQGPLEIERARIRRVQVRSGARRVRNLLIGAAIGVGLGVLVDQTVGTYFRNETGERYRALTYIAPIALFGGIAAAVPAYRTIYRTTSDRNASVERG